MNRSRPWGVVELPRARVRLSHARTGARRRLVPDAELSVDGGEMAPNVHSGVGRGDTEKTEIRHAIFDGRASGHRREDEGGGA